MNQFINKLAVLAVAGAIVLITGCGGGGGDSSGGGGGGGGGGGTLTSLPASLAEIGGKTVNSTSSSDYMSVDAGGSTANFKLTNRGSLGPVPVNYTRTSSTTASLSFSDSHTSLQFLTSANLTLTLVSGQIRVQGTVSYYASSSAPNIYSQSYDQTFSAP